MRIRFSVLVLASVVAAFAMPVQAQDGVAITLSIAPTVVDFGEFGGPFPAAAIRLSASTEFTRVVGAEASAFAVAPLGGQTSTPDCVPGGNCQTRSSPSLLSGFLASLLVNAGQSGLRGVLGAGSVSAQGGEGFSRRSTIAGLIGLDWIPRSNNRFAPTFSLRLIQLSANVGGARQLLLPGVGLRF